MSWPAGSRIPGAGSRRSSIPIPWSRSSIKITDANILSLEETRELMDVEVLRSSVEVIRRSRVIYLFGHGRIPVRGQGRLSEISPAEQAVYY